MHKIIRPPRREDGSTRQEKGRQPGRRPVPVAYDVSRAPPRRRGTRSSRRIRQLYLRPTPSQRSGCAWDGWAAHTLAWARAGRDQLRPSVRPFRACSRHRTRGPVWPLCSAVVPLGAACRLLLVIDKRQKKKKRVLGVLPCVTKTCDQHDRHCFHSTRTCAAAPVHAIARVEQHDDGFRRSPTVSIPNEGTWWLAWPWALAWCGEWSVVDWWPIQCGG
jgi:hypothetical protein